MDDKQRLKGIIDGLAISLRLVILPMHRRTAHSLARYGFTLPMNITAIGPVGFLDMVMLEKHASFIAKDSGGVQ